MAEESGFDAALRALSDGPEGINFEVADDSAFAEDKPKPSINERRRLRSKRNTSRARKPKPKTDTSDNASVKETVASIGSTAWGFAGYGINSKGPENLVPVGRVMMFQAPAAGNHIANIVERTPLMQLLAPLSMNGGLIGDIAALVGPPILIGLMANNPTLMSALQPFLKMIFIPLAKEIVEAQKSEGNILEGATEIDEDTQQILDMMMSNLFGEKSDGA